jgi:hypothetical protein
MYAYLLTTLLACASTISAISVTASDMPECALECYVDAGSKVAIPTMEYERQCRSAPFQIALRECAKDLCSEEEYEFVLTLRVS